MRRRIYSVGEVNNYIGRMFADDYLMKSLLVQGEVSNCKHHSSGHIYFTLKDDESSLSCIMFANRRAQGMDFQLSNGQRVIVQGNMSAYVKGGSYSLNALQITLEGVGDLHVQYEELKQRLYEEGLFDHELKKSICKYPKRVGIVTAKTGAAIQDIMNIARRRNPYVQLILYPAKVQGEGAAQTIVNGIQCLDKLGVDTIIIGRGGGSIEDLWAFNEEIVARAIFACQTPIISGTGHEIDNTIADYAADLRAATPSEACELAIPDVMSTIRLLSTKQEILRREMNRKVSYAGMRLESLMRHLQVMNPKQRAILQEKQLEELERKLHFQWNEKLSQRKLRLMMLNSKLNALSPTEKLKNGFGYIADGKEKPVLSASQLVEGDAIRVTLHDGVIHARVVSENE